MWPLILCLPLALSLAEAATPTSTARGDAVGGDTVGGDTVGGDTVGGDAVGGDAVGGDAVGGDAVGGDAVGGDGVRVEGARVEALDATRPPRAARVLGTEYTWRTGVLARQAWQQGEPYAFVGRLLPAGAVEPQDVACPLRIGGPDGACVLANELVEDLARRSPTSVELSVEGRILQVDGIRYVVLTAYEREQS